MDLCWNYVRCWPKKKNNSWNISYFCVFSIFLQTRVQYWLKMTLTGKIRVKTWVFNIFQLFSFSFENQDWTCTIFYLLQDDYVYIYTHSYTYIYIHTYTSIQFSCSHTCSQDFPSFPHRFLQPWRRAMPSWPLAPGSTEAEAATKSTDQDEICHDIYLYQTCR